jgi:hypothetical protein
MSLHVSKTSAMRIASQRELEAQRKGSSRQHSSGWRHLHFATRKRFGFLWEVYEEQGK